MGLVAKGFGFVKGIKGMRQLSDEAAIDNLFEWICSNKNNFSHLKGKTPDNQLKLLKPIGELALCCDIMIRNGIQIENANSILHWAWRELNEGKFLLQALIARPSLLMISSLYSNFHRNGYYNESLFNLIAYYEKSDITRAMQYPYWRRLDLDLAFYNLGISKKFYPKQEATWAYNQPEPWLIDNDSAYALTHEVFYLTDFGEMADYLHKKTAEYLKQWLSTWRQIFLMDDNLDIYTELLMVSLCIGNLDKLDDEFSVLDREVRRHGYIPGPENSGKNLMENIRDSARIKFLENYHTTLVGMMAYCMNSDLTVASTGTGFLAGALQPAG
jgi:hypothetical protein